MEYEESIRLALENGFTPLDNNKGHRSRLFVRNGLKWIHSKEALKRALGVVNDHALRVEGYDIETYEDVITNQRGLLRYA